MQFITFSSGASRNDCDDDVGLNVFGCRAVILGATVHAFICAVHHFLLGNRPSKRPFYSAFTRHCRPCCSTVITLNIVTTVLHCSLHCWHFVSTVFSSCASNNCFMVQFTHVHLRQLCNSTPLLAQVRCTLDALSSVQTNSYCSGVSNNCFFNAIYSPLYIAMHPRSLTPFLVQAVHQRLFQDTRRRSASVINNFQINCHCHFISCGQPMLLGETGCFHWVHDQSVSCHILTLKKKKKRGGGGERGGIALNNRINESSSFMSET